ncbi:DeoR/GlpR family DNA-binding transcription regulator [Bacillus changyiensis]|uniref:DeoR/GlpR family DNA-binding transcription regulator n=1 Tax=Bacillus changyiensis TaxID=3004103 RepID=UPI0022E1613C|nr:DeoR/GlpR family DNA-binding transcription regulator [Bacillus changyiensis]MDA1476460.1 DeoR/GlpR family DNA-binding transcription regulator [Bacillus changyiensis]
MIKEERYRAILAMLDKNQTVEVVELAKQLDVTDMTIRRDLQALENDGLLIRVHGGAKKRDSHYIELSHNQKQDINVEFKKHIGKICADLISDHDTVFIGSGTTSDSIFDYLGDKHVNVVTNSINVFQRVQNMPNIEVILTGGRYRKKTGTFYGYFANKLLTEIKVKKAFIGTNGISGTNITTANEEEGYGLQLVLNHTIDRYILADSTKFSIEAFFTFYDVRDITALITDHQLNSHVEDYYSKYTKIIK